MWQQSHGRWPFLMRRKVCLTNYPGGQTTCFSSATFSCLLSPTQVIFLLWSWSRATEPWHLKLIFAFELALPISMYWLFAACFLLLYFLLAFCQVQNLVQTAVHLDHRSERRWVVHKPLFDMKSIICKVDEIIHKCIDQRGVIYGYWIGLYMKTMDRSPSVEDWTCT